MSIKVPFKGVDRPVIWLRLTLLSALFFGLLASAPLWTNSHSFPLLPIISGFPILPSPLDRGLFVAMLLSLAIAIWFYRPAITFFVVAALFTFFEDQNRGQPWFYMYWVMLLLSLLPDSIALAACRVALSVAYVWSGIQKFNVRFFQVVPGWFVAPAQHWHLPTGLIQVLRWTVASAPVVELAIGLALWSPRLRKIAIGAAIALHLSALLFLGPLGYNYNWVVWPWNLAMIGLVWSLFGIRDCAIVSVPSSTAKERPGRSRGVPGKKEAITNKPAPLLKQTFVALRRSRPALVILGLYSLLPILSFADRWDSYFSFSLYSENAAVANIFISQDFGERLPSHLRPYVQRFPQAFDPQHQGPYTFGFQAWGYEELHVPPISELRNFRSVFRFLRAYSKEPTDLRMIVGQRSGPVIFYQGEGFEFLVPNHQ